MRAIEEDELNTALMRENAVRHVCCPISGGVMQDPVMAQDGYTYERESIELWIHARRSSQLAVLSPMTGLPLLHCDLMANVSLKAFITDLTQRQQQDFTQRSLANPMFEVLQKEFDALRLQMEKIRVVAECVNDDSAAKKAMKISVMSPALLFSAKAPVALGEPLDFALQDTLIRHCEQGDLDMVKMVCGLRGVNLFTPNKEGKYPLGAAICSLNYQLVAFVLETIRPDHLYINTVLSANKRLYGFEVAEDFKEYDQLSCSDVCHNYFGKNTGRHAIFQAWVRAELGYPYGAWMSIDYNTYEEQATTHTYSAGPWTFGSDDTKLVTIVDGLGRKADARAVVWGHFVSQYALCQENQVKIKKHIHLLKADPGLSPGISTSQSLSS